MKKSVYIIFIFLFTLVFIFNEKACVQEEVRKKYVETNQGSIKNEYTKENPFIMTINESYIFHMAFTPEEYPALKLVTESAVYTTAEGTIPSTRRFK